MYKKGYIRYTYSTKVSSCRNNVQHNIVIIFILCKNNIIIHINFDPEIYVTCIVFFILFIRPNIYVCISQNKFLIMWNAKKKKKYLKF